LEDEHGTSLKRGRWVWSWNQRTSVDPFLAQVPIPSLLSCTYYTQCTSHIIGVWVC